MTFTRPIVAPAPCRAPRRVLHRALVPFAAAAFALAASPALADVEYAYDDGVSNLSFGPPRTFEPYGDVDMLWGNYFVTQQAHELVTRVSFGLGRLSAGETDEVTVWIFDDPDNDLDPTNAVPIFSATLTAHNLGFDFNHLDLDPVAVSGGFFVAVGHLAELTYTDGQPGYPTPGRYDPDAPGDRSWFFYDSDIPESDLGSSGFVQRMDGPFVPIPGAFAIRATTIPAPGAAALGLAALAGATRRRRS